MKRLNFTYWKKVFFSGALAILAITTGNLKSNAQCLTPNIQWPSGTAVAIICTGNPQNITTNGYAGEYSSVSIENGTSYTFTSSNAADFITIGDAAGTVALASGTTPLTWTSTISGNIRFYTHTNATCGAETVNRTRSVSCAAPACPPPTAVSATSITNNGATIAWSGTGDFILEYGPAGFTPGTSATAGPGGTIIAPAVSPLTLSGLSASTNYNVYVRNNCIANSAGFSTNAATSFITNSGPPPVNDDCSGAIGLTINPTCIATAGTTKNATQSTTMPAPSCGSGQSGWDDDVWYSFTTDATQSSVNLSFTSVSGTSDLVAQVYASTTGNCSGTFSSAGCSDDNNGSLPAFNGLAVNPNTTYFVRVFSYSSSAGITKNSDFTICVLIAPPPPSCVNNIAPVNLATSVDINPVPPVLSWNSTSGATGYKLYIGNSVASATNVGTIITDTTFTMNGLNFGSTYFWYVVPVGLGGSATGCAANATSFTTEAPPPPPPAPGNDECVNAIPVDGNVSGNNTSATQSLPPSMCDGFLSSTATNDVWYSFVPETSGSIGIEVGQSSLDAIWEVYSGICGNLTSMGCRDDIGELLVNVNAGETYLLRVYGWNGAQGPFTVNFTGVPLPVEGLQLNGLLRGHVAELNWSTLREVNSLGFEIQRSDDGINFSNIGFVNSIAPGGNSFEKLQYSFSDKTVINGSVFYRLQQTDRDGKITISNIIRLSAKDDGSFAVLAAPNPASNIMVIRTIGMQGNNPWINITDVTGKVVHRVVATGSETTIDMARYSNGIYLIRYNDDVHNQVIKVRKQ